MIQSSATSCIRGGDDGRAVAGHLGGLTIRQSSVGHRHGEGPRARRARVAVLAGAALLLISACRGTGSPAAGTRFMLAPNIADSVTTEQLADGVQLHHLVRNTGPLRVHVLDIDLRACVAMRALKGSATAVGRTTTSALLRGIPVADAPIAAVNADFFLFAPPGVPVGALVVDGRMLAGPIDRPVLAFADDGRPFIGAMTVSGALTSSRARLPLTTWNRPSANSIGIVDALWGQALDSLVRPGALQLVPFGESAAGRRYLVVELPVGHSGQAFDDTLIVVGTARASILAGDTVMVAKTLSPFMPRTAVGGRPVLVRDSAIVPAVDTDGADSFRGVNPRTAAGLASNGRRLLLAVIDGRQAGFSVGTTTRETAALMLALGARDAVNLDGGGSTAMVVRDAATGPVRVVNKPSDATGERPVGDALAVTGRCSPPR